MPSKKTKQPILQLTITLSEVEGLRSKIAQLEHENAELQAANTSLKKQLHDLTDATMKADAAAFKRSRNQK